jgi:hypothetical protein
MIDESSFRSIPSGAKFYKTLIEGNDAASGIISLVHGASKPNKNSKNSIMFFYVLEGVVDVIIHKCQFKGIPGTQFEVPAGNTNILTCTKFKVINIV